MVFAIPAQHDVLFIGTVLVPHEIVADAGVVMRTTPTTSATILAKMLMRSMPSVDQDAPFVCDFNHSSDERWERRQNLRQSSFLIIFHEDLRLTSDRIAGAVMYSSNCRANYCRSIRNPLLSPEYGLGAALSGSRYEGIHGSCGSTRAGCGCL
jgi:hypothetical protein